MKKQNLDVKLSVILPEIIRNGIEEAYELAHKHHKDPSEKIIKDQLEESILETLKKYINYD